MEPCHTVDREAGADGKMSHLDLSVIYNGHFADLLLVSGIFGPDLVDKPSVDLLDDLIDPGKQP